MTVNGRLRRVVLIDDDDIDNAIHTRVLRKTDLVDDIVAFQYADDALEYLAAEPHEVDLIFLDINMPRMTGFEFLEEYRKLREDCQARHVVVMLTTSLRDDDMRRAEEIPEVSGYHNKPLTVEGLADILRAHFHIEADC